MAQVTVRYWAAAKHAAGVREERFTAATLGELREQLDARADIGAVCKASSFLVDGEQAPTDGPLTDGQTVDVLPPFAGG